MNTFRMITGEPDLVQFIFDELNKLGIQMPVADKDDEVLVLHSKGDEVQVYFVSKGPRKGYFHIIQKCKLSKPDCVKTGLFQY